tara:strand:- start:2122 stop:2811 length:690 start_codon:yes stop_codon:yes gene_type:complete
MVNNVTDINNNKKSEMNFLKEKMNQVGVTQKELANKLDRNVVTINRWFNEERQITPENAIKISKILKCDPAAILFPAKKINKIELHSYTDDSYMVKDLTPKYYVDVIIPDGFYTPETKAVKFYKIGSQHHGEIYLFERVKVGKHYEGFHEDSINKICYLEPISKKAKISCTPIIALVKVNETTSNYTLNLLNPKTQEPLNKMSIGIDPSFIKVSAPKKMSFFPKFNLNT